MPSIANRILTFVFCLNWLYLWMVYESGFGIGVEGSILVLKTNDTFVDRQASFGPSISDNGILGTIVPISNLLLNLNSTEQNLALKACIPIKIKTLPQNWIALVERGDCSFITKIRNLQSIGAISVIVSDPERNILVVMYATGDTSDIHIPSVFIGQTQYRELLTLIKMFNGKLDILMSSSDLLDWPLRDILFIVILSPTLIMIIIFSVWRYHVYQQKKKELAPESFVNALPTKLFSKEKLKGNEPDECAICLDHFENDALLRILPCAHEYHVHCIDGWLTKRKKFCPICKRDIMQDTSSPNETTPLLQLEPQASQSDVQQNNYQV